MDWCLILVPGCWKRRSAAVPLSALINIHMEGSWFMSSASVLFSLPWREHPMKWHVMPAIALVFKNEERNAPWRPILSLSHRTLWYLWIMDYWELCGWIVWLKIEITLYANAAMKHSQYIYAVRMAQSSGQDPISYCIDWIELMCYFSKHSSYILKVDWYRAQATLRFEALAGTMLS